MACIYFETVMKDFLPKYEGRKNTFYSHVQGIVIKD